MGQQHPNGGFAVRPVLTGIAVADLTTVIRRRLSVVKDSVRRHQHPTTGTVNPPAKVHVIAIQGQVRVEAGELLPDVLSDQHSCGTDGQDITNTVVLPLVVFALL